MPLHPILALDQVIKEYRDYLHSEFRAKEFAGVVKVAKYDRGTGQSEREDLQKKRPHILLTNYMMLEYLLVQLGDREDLLATH